MDCNGFVIHKVYKYISQNVNTFKVSACAGTFLKTKNNVIAVHHFSVGSLNSSIVHPREAFKSAIKW